MVPRMERMNGPGRVSFLNRHLIWTAWAHHWNIGMAADDARLVRVQVVSLDQHPALSGAHSLLLRVLNLKL